MTSQSTKQKRFGALMQKA